MADLAYPGDLTDGTVRLRPWAPGDLACVEQAATDPRIPENTSVPARYTPAEGLAFIHRQHRRLTSGQGVSLAIASHDSGEALGLVILQPRPQPGVAGLGYWVLPAARRRGLASRAVGLMTGWGSAPSTGSRRGSSRTTTGRERCWRPTVSSAKGGCAASC